MKRKFTDSTRIEDRILLSRFIDGDLDPADSDDLIALLATDPDHYRRFRHYLLTGDILRRIDVVAGAADESFVAAVMSNLDPAPAERTDKVVRLHREAPSPAPHAGDRSVADTESPEKSRVLPRLATAATLAVAAISLWLISTLPEQAALQQVVVNSSPVKAQDSAAREPARAAQSQPDAQRNVQLDAYLLSHSNHGRAQIGSAWGLVRVAAHSQSPGR